MDKILEIRDKLESIKTIDDFDIDNLNSLCEEIIKLDKNSPESSSLIEPLFRILENNSEYDFGMPGRIVHSLETYYKKGLEQELLKSLNRKPTFYTIWMLNRILNGTSDIREQKCYLNVLKSILHRNVSNYLREQVQHLIDLHS